jgi:hypothetical protein
MILTALAGVDADSMEAGTTLQDHQTKQETVTTKERTCLKLPRGSEIPL